MWLLTIPLFFVAGAVLDAFVARYTRAVAEGRPAYAATMSGLITVVNLFVIALLFSAAEGHIAPILAFASGNWVGTYVTVKRLART